MKVFRTLDDVERAGLPHGLLRAILMCSAPPTRIVAALNCILIPCSARRMRSGNHARISLPTPKDEQSGNNGHGSKIIVVPFDGVALDLDLQKASAEKSPATPAR